MGLDAPAAEVTITPDEVRRMTLRAQGFLGATSRRGGVAALLRRGGAGPAGTTHVLARSHELVAYARLGAVSRSQIEQAYWHAAKPAAFEYWAHAACVLPIEQWPYFAFRRRALRARGIRWHRSHAETCDKVLARLRAEGPLTATQLGGAKAGGPWVYDLPERVLPGELLNAEPSDPECIAYLAGVAARALGALTQADLVEYHRLNHLTSEKSQHTRLV